MHALFVELRAIPHQAAVLRDLLEDLTTVAGSEAGSIVYSFPVRPASSATCVSAFWPSAAGGLKIRPRRI